jgi:4'-phosphopantetheinyl transferase EntD
LLFSAKESVYKAWYQITGSWLDYLDAAVEFDASHGTFAARLLADSAPDSLAGRFGGRFAVTPDYVFTAVAVRAGG